MHELVLIERDPSSYKSWPGLIKKKKILDRSVEEVVDKYQGFEGDLVSYYLVENDLEEYKSKLSEYLKYKNLASCFILHLLSGSTTQPSFLQTQAIKVGYDVGFCDGETLAIYSSIFHEILFGHFEELIDYKEKLNGSFLFPSRDIAEAYVRLHDKMSAKGKEVEDIVEMTIYEVWRHKC